MRKQTLEILQEVVPKEVWDRLSVSASDNPEHGHYATNVAFVIAKKEKKNPIEVAYELGQKLKNLKDSQFSKVEVAEPGFINFWISDEALLDSLGGVLKKPDRWGEGKEGKGKTVVVEYFQPNIAKTLHVGHLRSAVIGDAVKRMLLSRGYKAVSDSHLGDWGTQFGILLHAYKGLSQEEQARVKEDPFTHLDALYVKENERIEEDPDRRELGKKEFARLERGDRENKKIWQWMVDVSTKYLEAIIDRLDLLPFDEHMNESVYEGVMPSLVKEALKRQVVQKDKEGAVFADLEEEGLGQAILIKSDGASTYLLRDLATLQHRLKKWKFWQNLYVVDVRQSYHFKQLFRVAETLGWGGPYRNTHVSYGFMSLPAGKMSTRKGTVIPLEDILDGVAGHARGVIAKKNPDLKDADHVAEQVGVGALKYFDLSHHRSSDVVFDRERALSFEGNTGPYIQYAHARLRSILRKAKSRARKVDTKRVPDGDERQLLVEMLRFPEVIADALKDYAPHMAANYVYGLAQMANEFYHSHPVMQEKDEDTCAFRLALVGGVAITLKNGLYLLGIEAPEEM
jgi:arginyl-tRNA synthetase